MTKHFGMGQEPGVPSRLKLNDRQIQATDTNQPTDKDEGIDVSHWRRVIVSIHPYDPDINDAACVGWRLTLKVWRWKRNARYGTGRPTGQWFAEEEITVSMDGDVVNGGPMEYEFPCWDSEKMHFQVVGSDYSPDNWIGVVGVYGLVPWVNEDGKSCWCESGGVGGGAGGGGGILVANMFDLLAHQDNTYSSLRGDFTAARVDATTIQISDLDYALEESQILAIGLKEAGAVGPMRMWYRDDNLRCDWDADDSQIDITGFVTNASDIISVWLEGPPKVDDPTNRARRAKVTNPDAYHVVTDGIWDFTIEESAAEVFYPIMMGQDGYHWLSVHATVTGEGYARLEATNDLDRDGNEAWYDVTQEIFGVTRIDVVTAAGATGEAFPPQSWCANRRLRWAIGTDGHVGTVKLYVFKSAYGNHWIPVAREDFPALGTGIETMGQARSVQAAAIDEDDSGQFVMNLYKELVLANFNWATQANRTEEDDPLDTRDVGEILADAADVDAGVTVDFHVDMAHMQHWSLQWIPNDVNFTLKVYASDEDNGTAPAACDYEDVTLAWFGAASFTARTFLVFDTNLQAKWLHIEVVRAGGVGTDSHKLYTRKCY